jgi:hypothetical protein
VVPFAELLGTEALFQVPAANATVNYRLAWGTTMRRKLIEIIGLPVLGAALIAIVQTWFPQYLESWNRWFWGRHLEHSVLLRANDEKPGGAPIVTNLTLTDYNGRLSGELRIPPSGTHNVPPEGGRRVYSGFLGGDGFLVLTYKSDPPLHGIGAYFFTENDDGNYVGLACINICTNRGEILKQCNIIFTRDQTSAIEHYQKALHEQCQSIEFPHPDNSDKIAEKEPCPKDRQQAASLHPE